MAEAKRDPNEEEACGETSVVVLLRRVPQGGGWRTFSENIDDPMAGSFLHGDLMHRAADHIDELEAKVSRLVSRGIEDMRHTIAEQAREIEALKAEARLERANSDRWQAAYEAKEHATEWSKPSALDAAKGEG